MNKDDIEKMCLKLIKISKYYLETEDIVIRNRVDAIEVFYNYLLRRTIDSLRTINILVKNGLYIDSLMAIKNIIEIYAIFKKKTKKDIRTIVLLNISILKKESCVHNGIINYKGKMERVKPLMEGIKSEYQKFLRPLYNLVNMFTHPNISALIFVIDKNGNFKEEKDTMLERLIRILGLFLSIEIFRCVIINRPKDYFNYNFKYRSRKLVIDSYSLLCKELGEIIPSIITNEESIYRKRVRDIREALKRIYIICEKRKANN